MSLSKDRRVEAHPVNANELPEDVVLACRNVGVCYRRPYKLGHGNGRREREFWPFKDVNLELRRGETLGVLGRNGSGKSTLLRLLAGVIQPDAGQVLKQANLNVQLLSVNLGFERILSGRENAIMAGILLGLDRAVITRRLSAIREFSELGHFFDEPVYTYSSGMLARLGFSIAIEADPDVLLLDEVLAVGDASFQEKSRAVTEQLMESGKSIIMVSHSQSVHEKMSGRVVEM